MPNAAQLIAAAMADPPKPVIENLLNEQEILGLHGPQEVFKTFFLLQLAESLAAGTPLLGVWPIPIPRRVFFLETEMSAHALATRMLQMRDYCTVGQIDFADARQLTQFQRALGIENKFSLLSEWLTFNKSEVLIVDTANPFFRGVDNPNDDRGVGKFFDLLSQMPVVTRVFARHNRKPGEKDALGDAAARIRGSGQWNEVPDALLELSRKDKRTNQATLSVSKYRGGQKPDDLEVWFDRGQCRLTVGCPEVAILQAGPKTRLEVVTELDSRFGISPRLADDRLGTNRYLESSMSGHQRVWRVRDRDGVGV